MNYANELELYEKMDIIEISHAPDDYTNKNNVDVLMCMGLINALFC